jgi:hypothetical protein
MRNRSIVELLQMSGEEPSPEIKFFDDPITLACASYRTWLEHPHQRWTEFDKVVVWEGDRDTANELRTYYRGRTAHVLFDVLKHTDNRRPVVSEFRRKLSLLVNNQLVITMAEIGLLHRLPYFYAEDLALDEIARVTESVPGSPSDEVETLSGEFRLLKRVMRSRRSGEHYQYWFTSDLSPAAYLLSVKSDNPLRTLIESLLTLPSLQLKARMFVKPFQGRASRQYFSMGAVELVMNNV